MPNSPARDLLQSEEFMDDGIVNRVMNLPHFKEKAGLRPMIDRIAIRCGKIGYPSSGIGGEGLTLTMDLRKSSKKSPRITISYFAYAAFATSSSTGKKQIRLKPDTSPPALEDQRHPPAIFFGGMSSSSR